VSVLAKHIIVSEKLHLKLVLLKLYSKVKISDLTEALMSEALNSPLLEKVLMQFLADPSKVRRLIERLNNKS